MGVLGRGQFLTALRRAYPPPTRLQGGANGPRHQHPTVLARVAQEAFPLLWRPTSAPWTNPIEQRWCWLTQRHLHHIDWRRTEPPCKPTSRAF